MYDQSFNANSLDREIRKSDFRKLRTLHSGPEREKQTMEACARAEDGFPDLNAFTISTVAGKKIVKTAKFSDELVLRKIDQNVKKLARTRQIDRDSIVANIAVLLQEGLQYRVYRLDIKSFYESISTKETYSCIEKIKLLSLPTKKYLSEILESYQTAGNQGLPRGLAVCGTISEIVLAAFDKLISSHVDVFYYSRYVDDIILITSGDENKRSFIKHIKSSLPEGLYLNSRKQMIRERRRIGKEKGNSTPTITTTDPSMEFEFLGYNFTVADPTSNDGKKPRLVDLDIAPSKVRKIKTRIAKCLISYCSNKNYELLKDRLAFLTSNFSVIDSDRDRKRLAGIYHNYHRVNFEKSKSLDELDNYLVKMVTSGSGSVCDKFYSNTTQLQRRKLLSWSFRRGFEKKVYLHFSEKRLSLIQRCWKYV